MIELSCNNEKLLSIKLFERVDIDGCTWTLDKRKNDRNIFVAQMREALLDSSTVPIEMEVKRFETNLFYTSSTTRLPSSNAAKTERKSRKIVPESS
jgi:hypothetical protein